jgi:murein DD-endopeptidase MepM/ murein hydrolase activator NlpD
MKKLGIATSLVVFGLTHVSYGSAPTKKNVFEIPVNAACISSGFGPRVIPNKPQAGTFHNGIDLQVPLGTPVKSVGSGVVIRAQRRNPGGLELLIQHRGYIGVYSHLGKVAEALENGSSVKAGDVIGDVGLTGVTSGPHLYFGLIKGSDPVDPAPLLGLRLCDTVRTTQIIPATPAYFVPGRKWYRLEMNQSVPQPYTKNR